MLPWRLRQFVNAIASRDAGSAPSAERLGESTSEWRRVLSRRYVEAMEPLQNTLVVFDQARDALVEAMNAHDEPGTSAALAGLLQARAGVLNAVNLESYAINLELAEYLKPTFGFRRRDRTWAELAAQVPPLRDDDGYGA